MEAAKPDQSSHPFELVHTGAHGFEQEWLDVTQAVVMCAEMGLVRTPKTIRKWAERSSGLPDGDILSRKEDTRWGYRWMIEKASLARKVEEELEFKSANQPEPVRTSASTALQANTEKAPDNPGEPDAHMPKPVQSSSHPSEHPQDQNTPQNQRERSANRFAPVQSGSEIELVLEEVRARMSDKDREIAFLRDQLSEAQIEIGKRAASTDEALKTIDRVVRSFEMQAEANRALALGAGQPEQPFAEQTTPTKFTPKSVDNTAGHQDIRRV